MIDGPRCFALGNAAAVVEGYANHTERRTNGRLQGHSFNTLRTRQQGHFYELRGR